MPIQAYFENIQRVLIENLEKAQTSLYVAVAWLTDKEIIRTLAQKAGEQVRIQVLITDDDINRQTDFEPLRKAGGKVWLVGKGQENALMHNKFCVIDSQIVITGSYNWSRQAQRNYENITITDEQPELASQFITEFEQIKRAFVETDAMAIDSPLAQACICIKRLSLAQGSCLVPT
jgi:phosphatidylserine/phosphatidylglycerophosphate/cardiolipin synthase-like enzyme